MPCRRGFNIANIHLVVFAFICISVLNIQNLCLYLDTNNDTDKFTLKKYLVGNGPCNKALTFSINVMCINIFVQLTCDNKLQRLCTQQ